MQVTINLTPILVTLIICVFWGVMYKWAREEDKRERGFKEKPPKRDGAKITEFEETKRSAQEKNLREYVENRVQEGENRP